MHENHRERMRTRYFNSGFEGFASHELLECLLYYSIPRKDTNGLSHELLERFGTIRGVLEASPNELLSVNGIAESTAFSLKLVMETLRRIATEPDPKKIRYDTLSKIGTFLCRKFLGEGCECVYLMLLNNRLELIGCWKISEGCVNCSSFPIRIIAEKALMTRASMVVLAHNHPDGLAVPSEADIELTTKVEMILDIMGIPLLEHIIVAGNRIWPILKEHCGDVRAFPEETLRAEPQLVERFYDIDHTTWKMPEIFSQEPIQ